MATTPPRTPPRFVPTLTEVVQVPGAVPVPVAARPPVATPVPAAARPAPAVSAPVAPATTPSAGRSAVPQPAPVRQPAAATPAASSPVTQAAGRALEALALRRAQINAATAPSVPVASRAARPEPAAPAMPVAAAAAGPNAGQPATARALPEGMEEYMVHRVMQRVDVVLDQRLRDAIAIVVQEQTRSVLPRLREEIESVVRHAVYEAVADELAGSHTAPTKG